MEILEQLGIALGLASLAGINLYLTVLLAGVVIRFNLLELSEIYAPLEALGHPWVIAVAGVLFALEFFADKVPWVDSLWDSVHTVIRPVGGTLLALQALGEMPPHMEVLAALVAGGATLTTHSAKAGSRLLINHSPEPVTNVTASVVEDVGVVGGLGLILINPVLAFVVFLSLLILLWIAFPYVSRLIRSSMWLIWNKLRMPGSEPAADGAEFSLPTKVPSGALAQLAVGQNAGEEEIDWSTEALTGRCKGHAGLGANRRVQLIGLKDRSTLLLYSRRLFGDAMDAVNLRGARVTRESRLLSEDVLIRSGGGEECVLRFPRGQGARVAAVLSRLETMAGDVLAEEPVDEPEIDGATPAPAT